MSEKEFQQAKKSLAFSQGMVDRLRASQRPEMAQEEPMEEEMIEDTMIEETPQEDTEIEATEEIEEKPEGEETEEESGVMAMLDGFMEEVRGLFKRKKEEDKVVIKETLKEMLNEDEDTQGTP